MQADKKSSKSIIAKLSAIFLRLIFSIFLILFLIIGLFLLFINLNDFAPTQKQPIQLLGQAYKHQVSASELRIISWNVGYGGLGSSMDFFYDGGQRVRANKSQSQEWLHAISRWIAQQAHADFVLLQEIDIDAKRSYGTNQHAQIAEVLPNHESALAINYQIPFVPIPLSEPMGQVKAGMISFSSYKTVSATRYAYPQIAGWPNRMFLLDRCFIETRFAATSGNELVILNTHNSAFIKDPNKMLLELSSIQQKMLMEYELGNYVIAGGDWNMNPPGFSPSKNYGGHRFAASPVAIPDNFFPVGWTFAFDTKNPTNRYLNQAYTKGITNSTTIDYFILSPNITLENVAALDLNFEASDHNPVILDISLN
ncbi:MAG: endonuclease/exonuclease/phosphatase family protein [Bacteroidetes bacterium]|jgi:endonuclease/exonuclease/phosphatase family metal-dependent hydrolase|nr:endonuclease/exonuclease/phosphatase family protein [Bacteroidota bacterium]